MEQRKKVFDALEWLAGMCPQVPNKVEQMVNYPGISITIECYSSNRIH